MGKYLGADSLLHYTQKVKLGMDGKVDKVAGKQLSTNDLTDELKEKILKAGDSTFTGNYEDLTNKPDLSSLHTHANKATLDKVTEAKLTEWDGKQTAAQVETAITSKGYQTAAQVESTIAGKGYQTAAQVQSAVAAAGHMTKEIVEALPAVADAKENVIYLVPKADAEEGNAYDEYMLIAGKLEKTGDTKTDLTGYLKDSDVTELSNAQIDEVWNMVFTPAPVA